MSMRYFTLSAVCMLIFCMLLALSGTTDFPGSHDEIVASSGAASNAPGLSHLGKKEAMASVYPLPEGAEPQAGTTSTGETLGSGVARNRPLLLAGIALVAAWVLLSFRLFSKSKD